MSEARVYKGFDVMEAPSVAFHERRDASRHAHPRVRARSRVMFTKHPTSTHHQSTWAIAPARATPRAPYSCSCSCHSLRPGSRPVHSISKHTERKQLIGQA
jgi:hypothetical protein